MNKDYQGISDSELAPGQPITSALMFRMRDDALAVTQNDPESLAAGIRGNFVGQKIFYSVPDSGSLTVPDGVRRIGVTLVGAGSGGQGATNTTEVNGTAGGDTSIVVNGTTYTAQGGQANGDGGGSVNIPFLGGLTVGGAGGTSSMYGGAGGSTMFGNGGRGNIRPPSVTANGSNANGFGAGGGSGRTDDGTDFHGGRGGGAGAVAMFTVSVTPGATINLTVGAGGAGGVSTSSGGLGGNGLIILEY